MPSLISILSLGTLIEWAEYTFYGYMALSLSKLFFPTHQAQTGLLNTFAIFALGYLMRPLGAIVFGHIGDKWGRKPALMGSLLLMGAATFSIGCLPTYSTLGLTAPWLLLILRMLQGIAISGEYHGAGIFLIENTQRNPCFTSSWVSASAAGGMVLGGLAAFIVSHPLSPPWMWRLPFLLAGTSCVLSLWLRRNIKEHLSPSSHPFPLLNVIKYYKKSLLLTFAISAFTGIFVYISNVYMVVFLKQFSSLPTHHATFFALFGEVIVMIFIPILGYFADRFHPYRQYQYGLLLIMMISPLIFILASSSHYLLILLAMIIYGLLNALVCSPMIKILYDQFPATSRYTGISLGWNLSAALFSGSAPLVAQYLASQWLLAPSFYISGIALITYLLTKLFPLFSATKAS